MNEGVLSREPSPGADPALGGSQAQPRTEEQRAGGPPASAGCGTRAPGGGAEDKGRPYLCGGRAGTSPKVAPARAREVTSRARRPEGGPARGGGRGVIGQTTPPGRGATAGAGPLDRSRLALPLARAGSFIFIKTGEGRVPCPRGAPPPGRRSLPGGGSGPSGAPPASASGREFPLGHNSKMCRSRSSAPSSLPWAGGLHPRKARRAGPGEGRLLLPGAGP